MAIESLRPFLLILLQTFGIVFFLEALVIYGFKLKRFWPSLGFAVALNFLSFFVLYGGGVVAGWLGYELNGLQLPVQVLFFFWWLSVMTDAFFLQVITRHRNQTVIYTSALLMNTLSFFFLYFFVLS